MATGPDRRYVLGEPFGFHSEVIRKQSFKKERDPGAMWKAGYRAMESTARIKTELNGACVGRSQHLNVTAWARG